ncbi:hypothetical protein DRQ09_03455 [candidate division KSB1 bacterium]|nr:MAG: hypothetical protein DRQ09_03455 [candidate division KSB1 bacterium]
MIVKIPEGIRIQYPEISWRDVAGICNKLIQEYSGVYYEMVWKTVITKISDYN